MVEEGFEIGFVVPGALEGVTFVVLRAVLEGVFAISLLVNVFVMSDAFVGIPAAPARSHGFGGDTELMFCLA